LSGVNKKTLKWSDLQLHFLCTECNENWQLRQQKPDSEAAQSEATNTTPRALQRPKLNVSVLNFSAVPIRITVFSFS
jgi:hypothetical protein